MPIFEWRGPEKRLLPGCTCTHLTIEFIKDEDGGPDKIARGEISIKDYVEGGIEATDPWFADGVVGEPGLIWTVTRYKDGTEFWVDKTTGEAHFTFSVAINDAMKAFIVSQLDFFLKTGQAVVELTKYTGPRDEYKGPCVCAYLIETVRGHHFDWEKATGGKFPQKCFVCSCGKHWWLGNTESGVWTQVADDAAFQMLLDYNGEPIQPIGLLDDKVFLLQTLRDRGLIPIG